MLSLIVMLRVSLPLAAVLIAASLAAAQPLPSAPPEAAGMSSQRLARLTAVMDSYAREKQIPGGVTLIARAGKVVYFEPSGHLDVEKGIRMPKDAIFRIASMSKAITTVGAMMLVEEGRLLLTDPVSKYIPAFANTTVRGFGSGLSINPIAARRRITIRDLRTRRARRTAPAISMSSTRPPDSTSGTSLTRTSRSAIGSRSSPRCRSRRTQASVTCTDTRRTFSAT